MRLLLLLLCLLLCVSVVVAAPLSDLLPTPKATRAAAGTVRLPHTYSLQGQRGPTTTYALELLNAALGGKASAGSASTLRLQLVSGSAALASAAAKVKLAPAPGDRWQEAFVLDCGLSGDTVTLTAGPTGLLYGLHVLGQLCDRQGEDVTAPRCAVSDWPTFLTRAYTGVPRDPQSASFLPTLDWLCRWRINGAYYELYGDQGQDSAPETVTRLHEECRRRGVRLYGQISNWRTELLLKRELCASNPEDLARIRRYSRELLDRGCDGLIFLFDDLTQASVEHPLHCEQCKAKFGNLAACQLELMRPMLEEARSRGVKNLIVCPTPYHQVWERSYSDKLDGKQYYGAWGASKLMAGVQVYHCDLRAQGLGNLKRAGLRDYIYWCNGFYSYDGCLSEGQKVSGLWGGLAELPFGWYTNRWDPAAGLVGTADAYEVYRELPQYTQHVWLCGGGEWPWALWGCYCWDADRFTDPEPKLLRAVYGPGTEAPYAAYKRLARRWQARLQGANATTPAERDAYLTQLTADVTAIEQAAQAFLTATDAARAAALSAAGRQQTAEQMQRTAQTLARLAQIGRSGQSTARLDEWRDFGNGVRERRMEVGDFWTRFPLRYSQTTETDGTKHRTQWHFGSGLGMSGPSYRNWYDAGFMDVLVDGRSLDAYTPEFAKETGPQGETLLATWKLPQGTLTVRFGVWQGGLRLSGNWTGDTVPALAVRLFAIPSAGNWPDMDKFVATPSATTPHGTPVKLLPGERWLFLADKAYDIPREHAEGPCAVLFGDPLPTIQTDNGSYVVQTDAAYPAGTRQFSLTVWDYHGLTNTQALKTLQKVLDH